MCAHHLNISAPVICILEYTAVYSDTQHDFVVPSFLLRLRIENESSYVVAMSFLKSRGMKTSLAGADALKLAR